MLSIKKSTHNNLSNLSISPGLSKNKEYKSIPIKDGTLGITDDNDAYSRVHLFN
jgi:hypothetical protein